MSDDDREARLARQLRENLRGRKARARDLKEQGDDPDRRRERMEPIRGADTRPEQGAKPKPKRGTRATEDDESTGEPSGR